MSCIRRAATITSGTAGFRLTGCALLVSTFAWALIASRVMKASACSTRCARFKRSFRAFFRKKFCKRVTVNPARSLRQENALGKVRCRRHADVLAVEFSGGDVFEQIIAFTGEPWIMAGDEVT